MIVQNVEAKKIKFNRFVKFTPQGNIFEIMAYDHKSSGNGIIKIDRDHYYNSKEPLFNSDGECIDYPQYQSLSGKSSRFELHTAENGYTYHMKKYNSTQNRAQGPNEIRKTFKRLRALINTNVTDTRKCKFITLTYAENMTDSKQLMKDLSSFNKRFKRYISTLTDSHGRNLNLTYEYISVVEPQARGAWHAHIIYIFNKQIKFIDNNVVYSLWNSGRSETKRGFTTTRKIDNVDNVGAYLTAYLADIEVTDDMSQTQYLNIESNKLQIKEMSVPDYDRYGSCSGKKKKKFIKGGRLSLYPPGFHIYRCSRGIKRPESRYCLYGDALLEIGSEAVRTFSKAVSISDGDNYSNTLTYEFYNKKKRIKRKSKNTVTSEIKIAECASDYASSPHPCLSWNEASQIINTANENSFLILQELEQRQLKMRC